MSIVKLNKITLCGLTEQKESVLKDLQELGCLHIIPFNSGEQEVTINKSNSKAREALKYILSCPQKRNQIHIPQRFDAQLVEKEALKIKERTANLQDERDFLQNRIEQLRPFGYFDYTPLERFNHMRLWFYAFPHYRLKEIPEEFVWQVVERDARFSYLVVISKEEPKGMPLARIHVGSIPLAQLEERLEEVIMEIEDLQSERVKLTRWAEMFDNSIHKLEDYELLKKVAGQTYDEDLLFALQAWIPRERLSELMSYSQRNGLAVLSETPDPSETPPTLMRNHELLAGGQDLLSFYMTPSYWLSDPSLIIFFSFMVFFAMIMSDAGYGFILAFIALVYWRKMGKSAIGQRLRVLFAGLSASTIIWGMLVGSYFGYSPAENSIFSQIKVFNLQNFDQMIQLTVIIGAIQVIIGNIVDAIQRRPSLSMLAPIGWIFVIIGGLLIVFTGWTETTSGQAGLGLVIAGLALVVGFAGAGKPILYWIFSGLQDITKVTSAFGDVLSYLRLFALGLASSSLAIAFNGLAQQAYESSPSLGLLFAIIILLIGHTLNFVLSLVSSVVHGLRLNLIEFLNWSTPEEGTPFKPFKKNGSLT